MKFVEPLWLLAGLFACGALLLAWRRYDARQRAALAAFAASHLHAQLTASFSTARRNWKRGLFIAATACLFVALARPEAGFRWEEVKRRGIEFLFAVDTSRSMLTPDVKPNRLTRAKLAVDDFVSRLNGDGVGLIAFAGEAFLQCPITLDYDAFQESLNALDTSVIPRGGTDIASAIREAQAALRDRPNNDRILVLITDGEDLGGNELAAAKAAAKEGLKICTVGVGTANGDLIPLPPDQGGGFVKDENGEFVKSRLDEAGLKAIAAATGGLYAPLGAEGQGLRTIYDRALAPLATRELASRQQKVYTERFQWPLAASLALLLGSTLIGTRRRLERKQASPAVEPARRPLMARGAAAALAGALLIPAIDAKASTTGAESAYQKGDFAAAQRDYAAAAQRDPKQPLLQFNEGAAAYKAGDFAAAATAFQKSAAAKPSADPERIAAQEDAYYDLGNTLYRNGQKTQQGNPSQTIQAWQQAVKTYDAALQLRANDADAKYNRDFVERKLEELKEKQEQKQQQQNQKQDQNNQNQQSQSQQNTGQQGDQKKDQKQDQQNQAGQSQEAQNQEKKDQNQKSGAQPKPDASQDQQQASKGSKPQPKPDQNGEQPKPATGQPQNTAQAQTGTDQRNDQNAGAGETPAEPDQMTRNEARALLDSLKDEQQRLPVARRSANDQQPDQPVKDW